MNFPGYYADLSLYPGHMRFVMTGDRHLNKSSPDSIVPQIPQKMFTSEELIMCGYCSSGPNWPRIMSQPCWYKVCELYYDRQRPLNPMSTICRTEKREVACWPSSF